MPEQVEVSPRSGGYATGRATKKAIVASAAHAFAQKGFYGASLRSIAREAGVDHSTLLHHFGNKTNLMLAVVGWHDQQQFLSELPVRMSAQGLVDAFVSTAESNVSAPGLVQLLSMLTAEAGAEGHPARAVLQRRHDRLISLLAWTIKRQRNRLGIEDELSPEQRAALVIATWDGLQLFDALHPGVLDVPELVGRELRLAFGLN